MRALQSIEKNKAILERSRPVAVIMKKASMIILNSEIVAYLAR
jgi:hypothetical protein